MNQVKNLEKLENLSYFDRNTLSQVVNSSDKTLYDNIQRWSKNNTIVQLKNGLYVTRKYIDKVKNKSRYLEFIANQLRTPSYLSTEYVLQKHSILTESVFVYTSITLKTKRTYQNSLGTFTYRSIKPELFVGFNSNESTEYNVIEASKEKAVFDYLYLKLFRTKLINKSLIDSFRLNTDSFTLKEKKNFEKYCNLAGIEKYKKLSDILF